jgi:hypothetical protein
MDISVGVLTVAATAIVFGAVPILAAVVKTVSHRRFYEGYYGK